MKVAVNLTNVFGSHIIDGVGQYSLNLLEGIRDIGELHNFHLIANEDNFSKINSMFPNAEISQINYFRYEKLLKWKTHFFRLLYMDKIMIPKILKKTEPTILFHPFNSSTIHIDKKVPTIVTIHDLFFKNFPEEHSMKNLTVLNHQYNGIIYETTHIIVPSEFVKQDIIKYYPDVDKNKITVINNPIIVKYDEIKSTPLKKPYILSVNSIRSHKNLLTLIKAFAKIEDQIEHHLVLTGEPDNKTANTMQKYIEDHQIKKIISTGYVSDPERNDLYQNADLFISPSLHEGFGMTPVEAALFKTPVLTTRETSIPEITKDLLHYYEPAKDENILAQTMLKLLSKSPDTIRLKEIKDTFAKEYNYQKIARIYLDFFQTVQRHA